MSYVYVLTAEHAEQVYFKIGYSKNSGESRVGSLKTGCPIPLLSLVDFELEDNTTARKVERILHRIYATSGSSVASVIQKYHEYILDQSQCSLIPNLIYLKGLPI